MIETDELPIIHLILNTDCNAFDLVAPDLSPGTCLFCYREPNRVHTDETTVLRVIDSLRDQTGAGRIVFTGGDPLMPYQNHLEAALERAHAVGFETNIHTNGLLLEERYASIAKWVSVFSLAIDGHDAEHADWFRGSSYHDRFWKNIDLLVRDNATIGLNTFVSGTSVRHLGKLAEQVADLSRQLEIEYWLISQYRPIGRANDRKKALYGFDPSLFSTAVEQARSVAHSVTVFDQPTRADTDPYPFRVWVLGDGSVTADLGSVQAPRNERLGNGLVDGFEPLIRQALELRSGMHV